jgi:hypothetical protein
MTIFWSIVDFFFVVTIQILTRHVRNVIGKESTKTLLMMWKIIMFDYEGAKTKLEE